MEFDGYTPSILVFSLLTKESLVYSLLIKEEGPHPLKNTNKVSCTQYSHNVRGSHKYYICEHPIL